MRRALLITIAIVVVTAISWFARGSFFATESMVFHRISIGDSEKKLVDVLNFSGITFHKGNADGTTVYSHMDGFVGVYFYYIQDGHVSAKAVD